MCVCACTHAHTQSWPILSYPVDCSPPGSSVPGIFPARILEWVAISSSRGSSRLRDQTHVSQVPCIDRWILYHLRHLGSPEYLYTTIFEDFCITRRRYYLFPGQRACLSAVLLCPQSNDEANFLAAPYCKIGRVPHL